MLSVPSPQGPGSICLARTHVVLIVVETSEMKMSKIFMEGRFIHMFHEDTVQRAFKTVSNRLMKILLLSFFF
jgi:hypothetical protein